MIKLYQLWAASRDTNVFLGFGIVLSLADCLHETTNLVSWCCINFMVVHNHRVRYRAEAASVSAALIHHLFLLLISVFLRWIQLSMLKIFSRHGSHNPLDTNIMLHCGQL